MPIIEISLLNDNCIINDYRTKCQALIQPIPDDIQIDQHDKIMDEKQLAAVTKRLHQQEQQIGRLVNLLLSVLDGKPGSDVEATEYLFIQTELYKYIDVGGDAALRQEERLNELKRRIVEMELRRYE